jgi:hypothetical protein
MEDYQC